MNFKFLNIIKQSLKAIFANKARSFLTILGIIIGIGSVIALLALGNGVQDSVSKQINSLGSTNITIIPGSGIRNQLLSSSSKASDNSTSQSKVAASQGSIGAQQTLIKEDLESIKNLNLDYIKQVNGRVSGSAIIKINNEDARISVIGFSEAGFEINNMMFSQGESFTSSDNQNKTRVVILGSDLANELFENDNPIGKNINILDNEFKVIGVLEKKETSSFSFEDQNIQAYIPSYTAFEIFKTNYYNSIIVQIESEDHVDEAKAKIEEVLLLNHKISDKNLADFAVTTPAELLSTINQVTGLLTSLLAGIAAISLLVGGIGIMNIMLVSVTERTREIGLRKAVGARTFDIMVQFITEAILLTIIGGLFGILLGFGLSQGAARALSISAIVTSDAILLAVGVSSIIGIIFGIYPAAKAARLNPIDALRYE